MKCGFIELGLTINPGRCFGISWLSIFERMEGPEVLLLLLLSLELTFTIKCARYFEYQNYMKKKRKKEKIVGPPWAHFELKLEKPKISINPLTYTIWSPSQHFKHSSLNWWVSQISKSFIFFFFQQVSLFTFNTNTIFKVNFRCQSLWKTKLVNKSERSPCQKKFYRIACANSKY